MPRYQSVEEYLAGSGRDRPLLSKLRKLLLSAGLEETMKWGAPCYTCQGRNVVGLLAFKSYVGLWFHQGALMSDPEGVLVNAQEGRTRAQRQWRFREPGDFRPTLVQAYIREAVELAESGKAIAPQKRDRAQIPDELRKALRKQRGATAAFRELTPGRQREYIEYFNEARRPETRARRLEKMLPLIARGAGLNEQYRRRTREKP